MSKAQIIYRLVAAGTARDMATLYADAFLEYREATWNIEKNGVIVSHPRTSNPIENPYLGIRDRALRKLTSLKVKGADGLWDKT